MDNINKTYPGVKALDDVSLRVKPNEIHALVGANGAGKSTLMKILAGIIQPDKNSGEIRLDNQTVAFKNPTDAQRKGISIVFQELNVIPDMSVLENIFLNREITRGGFYDWRAMEKKAAEIMADLELEFHLKAMVKTLSIAQQQMVEIVKAVSANVKLVILDEPTSSLTVKETAALFRIMKKLHENGIAIIYITHRLDEIYENCGAVTVIRDGRWIFTKPLDEVPMDALVTAMVGRDVSQTFPEKSNKQFGEEILRVEGLTSEPYFRDISFSLCRGEILGLAGLVGAGRSEVCRAVFGALPLGAGTICFENKPVRVKSTRRAIDLGIAYATEDRKYDGLMLGRSIRENATISCLKQFIRSLFLLDKKKERRDVRELSGGLSLKTPGIEQPVSSLSGGNQQKVCLVKWLLTKPKVIIFDEPTRGIDVGSKEEFYHIISDLASQGLAIILISSEESELIGLSDRMIVLKDGNYVSEMIPYENCEIELGHYMFGLQYGKEDLGHDD